ncbi:DMT family transporter [Nubsella zeaxanthinifaciens]|uniref:DMT family transporter n=1 Tax=Nubsella zeaxanthinifaciens TaxID=392412 RepID=UPI000DE3E4D0|nr:DMT family transporter [Nubsella zeaxanthinifaciens]
MTPDVLFLVLSAAVLHAVWNLISKKANGKAPFVWLMYIGSTVVYLPLLVYHIASNEQFEFSEPMLWFSLSSAILHIAYFLILQKGYRKADLSVVYPLARGSGPLLSSMAAIVVLKETFGYHIALGLALILAGVLVITGLSFKKGDKKIHAGIFWGSLTGLFIALYTLNDAIAIKNYQLSPLQLTFSSNAFSTVLLIPLLIGKTEEIKSDWIEHKWSILAIATLSPAAYILVLEALKLAPLTIIAPARETSILIGVFMGSKALNETDGKRRIIASALILCGIVALSLT